MTSQAVLIILSVVGAIFVALLGWAESSEPFDPRKFLSSAGRAVVAGCSPPSCSKR